MLCADFDDYCETQQRLANTYKDQKKWVTMVVNNLAKVGEFSSDRTIHQYADEIWDAKPVSIDLGDGPSFDTLPVRAS